MDSKKSVEQIERFSEDRSIKGVIIRVNSPGGAVGPSQEIYEAVKKLSKTKPVYCSMGSLAASGGYYIALGAKKIFANPGTLTGSIGVIMQFADLSKLYQWAKINPYNIKTGKFKDTGSPSREMTEEEKVLMQSLIENVLGQFRRAVAESRGLPMVKVVEVSDGRVFSGEQAKDAKLVDELGGFTDVVDALAKETGIRGKPNIVYASRKKRLVERLLGDMDDDGDSESESRFSSLLEGAQILSRVVSPKKKFDIGAIGPLFMLPKATE